jgi:hypothetical protein
MPDKIKEISNEPKSKVDAAELQEWLDAVHFGSCCSDPLACDDTEENKIADKKSGNKD